MWLLQRLWLHRIWYSTGCQWCRCIYEPVQPGWPVSSCRKGEFFSSLLELFPIPWWCWCDITVAAASMSVYINYQLTVHTKLKYYSTVDCLSVSNSSSKMVNINMCNWAKLRSQRMQQTGLKQSYRENVFLLILYVLNDSAYERKTKEDFISGMIWIRRVFGLFLWLQITNKIVV